VSIGQPWQEVAAERIRAGEPEAEVRADYGRVVNVDKLYSDYVQEAPRYMFISISSEDNEDKK